MCADFPEPVTSACCVGSIALANPFEAVPAPLWHYGSDGGARALASTAKPNRRPGRRSATGPPYPQVYESGPTRWRSPLSQNRAPRNYSRSMRLTLSNSVPFPGSAKTPAPSLSPSSFRLPTGISSPKAGPPDNSKLLDATPGAALAVAVGSLVESPVMAA